MNGSEGALRRTAWTLQALGLLGSTVAVVIRWGQWGGLEFDELGGLLGLLFLFWSPYVALAVATRYLGRGRVRLLLLAGGSLLVLAWDAYWRVGAMLLDPDTVAELMAPILITGTQWMGVVLTVGVVALMPAPGRGAVG